MALNAPEAVLRRETRALGTAMAGPLTAGQRAAVVVALAGCAALAVGIGYSLAYGLLALGVGTAAAVLFLAPRFGFYAFLFSVTGWPYYIGFDVGRDVPLPAMLFVIAALWAFVLLRSLLGMEPRPPRERLSRRLDLFVALLFLVVVANLLIGVPPAKWGQPLLRLALVPLMLFMICRHFMRDADVARTALDVLLAGAIVGGCYAVAEWFMGQNPLLERYAPPDGDRSLHGYWDVTRAGAGYAIYRSHGFGLNPIFFATTLAMLLVHAAVRFAGTSSQAVRAVFVVAGLLGFAGLGSTFSRGPILACGGGLALCAIAYPSLRKYIVTAVVAFVAYASFDLLSEDGMLSERIRETDNITLRVKLWQTAFAMFADQPVFGVGIGQFPEHQLEVIRRHGIGPFFEMGDGRLESVRSAEHAVLQFLAEAGIVGGIAAALVMAGAAAIYVPAMLGRVYEPQRALIVAAGNALIVFLRVGFTVTIYNSWEAACLVPVMLAVLCAARGDALRSKAP